MRLRLLAGIFLAFLAALPLHAEEIGVAAVINRDVVTSQDVDERIKLAIALTGKTPDEETLKRLRLQMAQKLVDETLQRQEATRQGVTLSEKERSSGMIILANSQQKTPEELEAWLAANGIAAYVPLRQIQAEMLWTKYLINKVQPRIQVSEAEMEEAVEIITNERGFDEWRIAEILIPPASVEGQNPEEEAAALKAQVDDGTDFIKLAAQYTPPGVSNDDNGTRWVNANQLPGDVLTALEKLEPNQVSAPVVTASGVYLIKLFEKRRMLQADPEDTELAIRQAIIAVPENANATEVANKMALGKTLMAAATCDQLTELGGQHMGVNVHDLGRMQLRELEANVKPIVKDLPTGRASEPFITPLGVHVLMVCERIEARSTAVDRAKVRDMLIQRKLGLESVRLMRNLRRTAFIEIRR